MTTPSTFVGTERLFASLEKVGERFTFGIDPSQLREFLSRAVCRSRAMSAPRSIGRATSASCTQDAGS